MELFWYLAGVATGLLFAFVFAAAYMAGKQSGAVDRKRKEGTNDAK